MSLCSVHFENSCYSVSRDAALQFGIRAKLKDDAVPSIEAAIPVREEGRYANFVNYCLVPKNLVYCDLCNIELELNIEKEGFMAYTAREDVQCMRAVFAINPDFRGI